MRSALTSTVALTLAAACSALSAPSPAGAQAAPNGVIVVAHPRSQPGLSYFKLQAGAGTTVSAGTIELRNPTARRLLVAISAVDGETLSTLGSGYAPAGSPRHGSARWLRPGAHALSLPAHADVPVALSLTVPAGATPGDHLSGISVEELGQRTARAAGSGVSIASVDRYVIGVEVTTPGPRTPLIRLTDARIERQPAGLAFSLAASNPGDVILQGVHGEVTVATGGHTVLARSIEAGTFVSHTAIAYPITAFGQRPAAGTSYVVTAWMRYPGGIARLRRTLTFGGAAARAQARYGHDAPTSAAGIAWWEIAAVVAIALYAIFTTVLLLRRRGRATEHAYQP